MSQMSRDSCAKKAGLFYGNVFIQNFDNNSNTEVAICRIIQENIAIVGWSERLSLSGVIIGGSGGRGGEWGGGGKWGDGRGVGGEGRMS